MVEISWCLGERLGFESLDMGCHLLGVGIENSLSWVPCRIANLGGWQEFKINKHGILRKIQEC